MTEDVWTGKKRVDCPWCERGGWWLDKELAASATFMAACPNPKCGMPVIYDSGTVNKA
jgi:hypothetical protein